MLVKKNIPASGHIRKDGPGTVPHACVPSPKRLWQSCLSGSPGTEDQPGLHSDLSPKEKTKQNKKEKGGYENWRASRCRHRGKPPSALLQAALVLDTRSALVKNLRERPSYVAELW